MRTFRILTTLLLSLNAQAARTGTDERIHVCTSGSDGKHRGANQMVCVYTSDGYKLELMYSQGD